KFRVASASANARASRLGGLAGDAYLPAVLRALTAADMRLLRRAAWRLWMTPLAAVLSTILAHSRMAVAASSTDPWASLSRKALTASRMVRRRQRLRARASRFWRMRLRAETEWAMRAVL